MYLQLCSLSGHIFPGTAFQQSRSFPRNRVSSHRPSSLLALLGLISARSAPFPPVAPATLLSPRILLQWCGSVAVTAVVVFSYARTRNRSLQYCAAEEWREGKETILSNRHAPSSSATNTKFQAFRFFRKRERGRHLATAASASAKEPPSFFLVVLPRAPSFELHVVTERRQ